MNGARRAAVKQIMKAIDNGTLPADETKRRLFELIEKEAHQTDRPADNELVSACLELLEQLMGQTNVMDEERTAALNQRIAAAIKKKEQHQDRVRIAVRTVGAIAAVLVLLVGIGIPLRWTWFESRSTPDEQQYVIMGHEITVDMVETAIAASGSYDTTTIPVDDFTQIDKILGFPLNIPAVLAEDWIASKGFINYFPGYIKVSLIYANKSNSSENVTCTVSLFTDIEYAYFSFEQSLEGDLVNADGVELYVSDNITRASACWYDNNMYVRVAGDANRDEITKIATSLLGGKNE